MQRRKVLFSITNHSLSYWADGQAKGWDRIEGIPFPYVPPYKSKSQLLKDEVAKICQKIRDFYAICKENEEDGYIHLQGDFSTCYYVYMAFAGEEDVKFVFPTTEKIMEEVQNMDGTFSKRAVFKFVRWR